MLFDDLNKTFPANKTVWHMKYFRNYKMYIFIHVALNFHKEGMPLLKYKSLSSLNTEPYLQLNKRKTAESDFSYHNKRKFK
jgi:hypothetical protein